MGHSDEAEHYKGQARAIRSGTSLKDPPINRNHSDPTAFASSPATSLATSLANSPANSGNNSPRSPRPALHAAQSTSALLAGIGSSPASPIPMGSSLRNAGGESLTGRRKVAPDSSPTVRVMESFSSTASVLEVLTPISTIFCFVTSCVFVVQAASCLVALQHHVIHIMCVMLAGLPGTSTKPEPGPCKYHA
jgi:hypothetical protein